MHFPIEILQVSPPRKYYLVSGILQQDKRKVPSFISFDPVSVERRHFHRFRVVVVFFSLSEQNTPLNREQGKGKYVSHRIDDHQRTEPHLGSSPPLPPFRQTPPAMLSQISAPHSSPLSQAGKVRSPRTLARACLPTPHPSAPSALRSQFSAATYLRTQHISPRQRRIHPSHLPRSGRRGQNLERNDNAEILVATFRDWRQLSEYGGSNENGRGCDGRRYISTNSSLPSANMC